MSGHLVFQSKVLQRLYPAAPKSEKEPSPPRTVEALAKPNYGKRETSRQENTAAGTMMWSSQLTFTAFKSAIFCEIYIYFFCNFPFDPLPLFKISRIPNHHTHWNAAFLLLSPSGFFAFLYLHCLSQEMQERRRAQPIRAGGCTRSYLLPQTTRLIQRNPSHSLS